MKNLLKRIPKKAFVAVATIALVAGVASQAIAGFGPNREIRDFANNQGGFNHVTFNSFTNVPNGIGDERDFFRGSKVGPSAAWTDPVTGIAGGTEVEMKILVHNNANPALNDSGEGVAKNVNVRAVLPTGIAQSQQATAYISASNAQPQQIWDTLDMTGAGGGFFQIEYIPGSAKVYNHENGQTSAISDSLVTTGVNLGDQKGCVNYIREVTFRVRVRMTEYKTQKTARLKGEDSTKWRKTVNAKVGDQVEWRIWFANSGTTRLNEVSLVDKLPSHTTVVGNIEMDKGSNPTAVYGADSIKEGGKSIHINMGDFLPGGGAYVYYTTKINSAKELECGINQIINTAYPAPKGMGSLVDQAAVNVFGKEDCKEPEKPKYICESLKVEKLGGRKVRATVSAPASGGATFKNVTLNWGDGSQAKVTDQLVNEYTYAADGTYKVTASVTFTVNGVDKTVTSDACAKMVTFEKVVEKCPIPGKEHLPKDSPECKETPVTPELPSTGAGSMIGLFAIVTLLGAVAHNVLSRRVA